MKFYIKNKYWKLSENYDTNKVLYLLIDRPNYINSSNDVVWINKKGQLHRNYDLPAYVYKNCHFEWCKNNKCHRENNKPARIFYNGYKQYCINGNFIKEAK